MKKHDPYFKYDFKAPAQFMTSVAETLLIIVLGFVSLCVEVPQIVRRSWEDAKR